MSLFKFTEGTRYIFSKEEYIDHCSNGGTTELSCVDRIGIDSWVTDLDGMAVDVVGVDGRDGRIQQGGMPFYVSPEWCRVVTETTEKEDKHFKEGTSYRYSKEEFIKSAKLRGTLGSELIQYALESWATEIDGGEVIVTSVLNGNVMCAGGETSYSVRPTWCVEDTEATPKADKQRGFQFVDPAYRTLKDEDVELPLRGTRTSAGYDFVATEDLVIYPQDKVMFKTDVKAYMKNGEVLLLDVRSSLGFKHDIMITNTIPVIDSDYCGNPENDGNIGIGLRNLKPAIGLDGIVTVRDAHGMWFDMPVVKDLKAVNTVYINKGDRVCQGIFVEFKESDNCNTKIERTGGSGSTSTIGGK